MVSVRLCQVSVFWDLWLKKYKQKHTKGQKCTLKFGALYKPKSFVETFKQKYPQSKGKPNLKLAMPWSAPWLPGSKGPYSKSPSRCFRCGKEPHLSDRTVLRENLLVGFTRVLSASFLKLSMMLSCLQRKNPNQNTSIQLSYLHAVEAEPAYLSTVGPGQSGNSWKTTIKVHG